MASQALQEPSLEGQTLGHYRILERIGRGGQALVYRARDLHLECDVAVKVLPAGSLGDEEARRRFRREALALSQLNHPNIEVAHDFDSQGGVDFLVTEYIPGQTLEVTLSSRLAEKEILELGAQLAEGLAAAHEQGVVHRDLKPANLLVTPDGRLKILDFGLARVERKSSPTAPTDSLSQTLGTVGTLPYMSPEQVSGRKADARSDIWGAGAVLYEMATRQRPFPGSGVPLADAIRYQEPPPPRQANPEISVGLEGIILRCLEKEPDHRYQSARELAMHLRRLARGEAPLAQPAPRRRAASTFPSRAILLAVLVALAAVVAVPASRHWMEAAVAAAWNRLSGAGSTPVASSAPAAEARHIAVLPFDNLGNDPANEALAQGLMDSMTSRLTNLEAGPGGLWVVPASVVLRRKVEDPAAAGRELGATLVVKGSIRREGNNVHLTVNLIDTRTLRQIGSAELEDRSSDLAALQDEAVTRLARLMDVTVTPDMLRAGGSSVPAAYDNYLKALGYLQRYDRPGNVDRAIAALQEAVRADPRFAVGYGALGQAYYRKYIVDHNARWIAEATANCHKALELDDRLPSVHVTLGHIHARAGEHDLALQEFQKALDVNPRDAEASAGMAHVYEEMGRAADAEAAYRKAIDLRPDYWDGYNTLGMFYKRNRRYAEAEAQLRHALELTPDNAQVYSNLASVYLDSRDPKKVPAAERALQKSVALTPNYAAYANLGFLYLQQERYAESVAASEKSLQLNDKIYIVWENLALAYLGLGQKEKAAAARQREIQVLEQDLKVAPNNAQAHGYLAALYSARKAREPALRHAGAALALAPNDPLVLVLAGSTYENLGDRRRALQYVHQALAKGYSLDELKRDPDLQALLADPAFHPPSK